MKPFIKDFFIKCDQIQDLVTFTEEILNGKHFFGSKMCDEAVRIQLSLLEFVTDHLKNQEMCNETMHIDPLQNVFSLIVLRSKRCTLAQLRQTQDSWTMFLITLKPMICVMM